MAKAWISIGILALIAAATSCGGGAASSVGGGNGGGGNGGGGGGAMSWQKVSVPSGAIQVTFFAVNSSGHWFLADRSKGFFRSTNQGATWTPINSGLATTLAWTISVDPANGDLIASIYSGSSLNANPVNFYRSTNEGGSWTLISTVHFSSATADTGCVFPANNIVCGGFWASNPSSGGWVSTNGGQTATSFSSANTMGTSVYSLAINPSNGDVWLGTEQMGIFRSTDNGVTWTQASPPDQNVSSNGIRDGNVYGITFNSSGDVLFSSQGGIWKSSPNGSGFSWSNVLANGNTANGHGMARSSSGELFYGHNADPTNNTSVECSTDNGSTWSGCDSGMPSGLTGHEFVVSPADGKLYAVMHDEGAGTGALYVTTSAVQ